MADDAKDTLTRATLALRKAKTRIAELENRLSEPIAIVGLSCRFPGADTPEAFWSVLERGEDRIREIPSERIISAWHEGVPRWAGILDQVDGFDAAFFGISPREAIALDPQQRLTLEVAWEAIERANIVPASLNGSKTGVFLGLCTIDHQLRIIGKPFEEREAYDVTGNLASTASGRVSYLLGLHGPAVTLDTACSSSLLAIHLACASLRSRECSLALAGGTHLILSEEWSVGLSRSQALSPDGRCKTFDASANGFVRGEGCGMLVLERLSDAERNGRRILAVIRASAANQDGKSTGLTAPNVRSQQALLRDALALGNLDPAQVSYMECHGTGTSLGDPIEVEALKSVFASGSRNSKLWLGAVKTVIGHLEAASGVASVIKVVLAMQYGFIPRNLHLRHLNPRLRLEHTPLTPVTSNTQWQPDAGTRIAGVSAFGFSGTNVNVFLEESPRHRETPTSVSGTFRPQGPIFLVLSGQTEGALRGQAARLRSHLEGRLNDRLDDVGFSLATCRSAFAHRAAVTVSNREAAYEALEAIHEGRIAPNTVRGVANVGAKLAFLFSGQGAQRSGMGRELREIYPKFREVFDDVCAHFDKLLDKPLREVIFADQSSELDRTAYTQPALFTLEVALFRLYESWGIRPELLLGHSIGEIVAAHVAGVLTLADACTLVAARSRLMDALPEGGAMVSLQASEDELTPLLEQYEGVDIAGLNGPRSTVLSGDEGPVLELAKHFEARGRKATRLVVSHAFHSHRMDSMLESFRQVVSSLQFSAPRLGVVSNVTGNLATVQELSSPDYWVRHARAAVRFGDGVRTLETEGATVFLELGPHGVLTSMATACLSDAGQARTTMVTSLRRDRPDSETLALAIGTLHCNGIGVDWQKYFEPYIPQRVELPTYAFQRERYWLEPSKSQALQGAGADNSHEAPFWAAVEQGDLESLSSLLEVDESDRASLAALLPTLGNWHRIQGRRARLSNWRYRVQWHRVMPPNTQTTTGTWAVAVPEERSELVDEVLELLAKTCDQIVRLELGGCGSRPQLADQLTKIAGERQLAGIVSLAALDIRPHSEYAALSIGLGHNLALVQAIGDLGIEARVWLLSRGAVCAGPVDVLTAPAQALSWGLGRVAALEYPRVAIGSIDLPPSLDSEHVRGLGAALHGDIDDQLALRGDGWHVARLTYAPIPARYTRFQTKGTALITGGTGALGAYTARWLVDRGAEHIVLTSRRGGGSPDSEALRNELEQLGARVTIARCDISVREELAALLVTLDAEGFRPTTIVHAAGVAGSFTPLAELTLAEFATVADGKVAGAQHLHELTRTYELDAFILFASISGVWGSARQAAYSSANAYLDALAQHRACTGLAASSIAWGPWAGGGMVDHDIGEQFARVGLRAMEPMLAIDGLDFATEVEPCMTIVDVEWEKLVPALSGARRRPFFQELDVSDNGETGERDDGTALIAQLRSLAEGDRLDHVLTIVVDQTAMVLGFGEGSSIDPDTGFADLGLDSLMAVELRQRLQHATGLSLPATLTFDYPSPIRAAQLLLDLCAEAYSERSVDSLADAELRRVLEQIPFDALRKSGLVDALIGLSKVEHEQTENTDQVDCANEADFDALDDDALLDAANALLGRD